MSDTEVFFNGEAGDELFNYNICEVGIVYKQKHTVYLFLRDFNSASCDTSEISGYCIQH